MMPATYVRPCNVSSSRAVRAPSAQWMWSASRALFWSSSQVASSTGCVLQILDAKAGFLVNGCITVSATVLMLEESTQFTRDSDSAAAGEESLRYAPLCHTACLETSIKQSAALYIPSRAFLVFVATFLLSDKNQDVPGSLVWERRERSR